MTKAWVVGLLAFILLAGCRYSSEPAPFKASQLPALKKMFHRTEERVPLISAHRGGPYPGFPENCLETFEHVLSYFPVLIECDVAISGDGTLVLMHDETVDRTTNGKGKVSDLSWEQLQQLTLVDNHGQATEFRIPSLQETLHWANDR